MIGIGRIKYLIIYSPDSWPSAMGLGNMLETMKQSIHNLSCQKARRI